MSSLTLDLGRFVADLSLRQIPAEGCKIARTGIADCFGVLIAGARDPEIALVDRELGTSGGAALASLIPSGARRSTETAALVNGVAAHVLDYDDVSLDGHPSAVLVPAILAQGEASGSSGAEMLTAYIAGYEVWAELLAREPTPLHRKGWHPTTVLGTIAAAAAVRQIARPRCQGRRDRNGDCRLDGLRRGRQFRHHDEILPSRPRRAIRRHCRAPGASRVDGVARRARAPGGFAGGAVAGRQGRTRSALRRRAEGVAHRRSRAEHQALSDLLCDPPLHRCRARFGRPLRPLTRRGRAHSCLDRKDAAA